MLEVVESGVKFPATNTFGVTSSCNLWLMKRILHLFPLLSECERNGDRSNDCPAPCHGGASLRGVAGSV